MKSLRKEIMEELITITSGKTLDALLPPLFFTLINVIFNLTMAIIISITLALIFFFIRVIKKQKWQYALGGLAGVIAASSFAYFSGNAVNYFIPKIIGSAALLTISLISIIAGKPLAAWVSHLTRGWDLKWFWRNDVKPAYQEVSIFWAALVLIRMLIQIILLLQKDIILLTLANTILGLPFTLLILVLSYVYGIWRLRRLNGPSIEEFIEGKEPPWKGQSRGF